MTDITHAMLGSGPSDNMQCLDVTMSRVPTTALSHYRRRVMTPVIPHQSIEFLSTHSITPHNSISLIHG